MGITVGTPEYDERAAEIFAIAVEASPLGISVFSLSDGRSILVNDAYLELLGCSREEVEGRPAAERAPFETSGAWLDELRACPEHRPRRAQIRRRSGEVLDVLASLQRVDSGGVPMALIVAIDVTDTARAEEELRRSHERLRDSFDAANAGKSITSPNGEISVNQAFADMLGYDRAELARRAWQELTPPEDVEAITALLAPLMEGRTDRTRFDKRYVKRDGTIVWADVSTVLRRDAAGEPLHFTTTVVDITARKRAEDALRQSEAMFSGAFRFSPAGLTITRISDGTFIDVNDAFCNMFGLTREEAIGHTSVELGILTHAERQQLIARQLESGGLRDATLRARSRSGNEVEIIFSSRPLTIEGAQCHVTTMVDVTARRHAETALRASDERFRAAFEQAAVGIAHTSLDGRWQWVNERLCALLGRSREQLLELTMEDVTCADDREPGRIAREQLRAGALESYSTEKRLVRGDGETVWVHHAVTLVRTPSGEPDYLTSVVEDISERKHAETTRSSLEAQLLVTQKLEAVARLAGGVAHDFNNLLSVILGNATMVVNQLGEHDPLRADLLEIKEAGLRAAALTRQLLAFSRRQPLQPQALDLNKAVENVETLLQRLLGEGIEVEFHLDAAGVNVKVDPGQLEQVIMNLVVNARDAMPRGGVITIGTTTAVASGPEAERRGIAPGPYAVLTVADTGTGMDAETQARMFEPFFTTKEQGKGTGLGLSTTYGIVKQSGGDVAFRSELGRGTVFDVWLPRVDALPAEKAPAQKVLPTGHETVLVVEDEAGVRRLVERVLRSAGYRVIAAASGGDALIVSEDQGETIDLVITDLVMPHLGGRDLAARLVSRFPRLRVLFISGYDLNDQGRAFAPDEQFLPKPFTAETLTRRVREILDAR